MKTQKLTLATGSKFSVDAEAGVLRDLALLTADREAKGHGIHIDAKTLTTGLESIQAKGGKLKAYITHGSLKELFESGGDRVMKVPGYFSEIQIKGNQLVAGTFQFYDAFREDYPREYKQLLEMAAKTPDLFGLSIEAYGYTVFIDTDGHEFSEKPEDDEDREYQHDGLPVLRITDLAAASFVSEPAANDGLFAKLTRLFSSPADLSQILESFAKFAAAQHPSAEPLNSAPIDKDTNSQTSNDDHSMKIIEQINAKFGAEPARFSTAMTLLGKEPTITIDTLERKLIETDLAAAQTKITELSTQMTELAKERDALKTERDNLKASLGSGYAGVNLGLPATGENGQENPFSPKTLNFTKQAELLKTDPALAKQLQAAAANA